MNEDTPETPVNLIDLIEKLAEPSEPAPISMMPQTIGWLVLALILLVAQAWLVWRFVRHWRANAYRRAALVQLSGCGDDPGQIADILRRTALAAWPRERVASLAGDDWIAFLDATGGGGAFADGPGQLLIAAPYRSGPEPVPELSGLAERWVRRHRVEALAP